MSVDLAIIKILESSGQNLNHFMSAFPAQVLLRVRQVPDSSNRIEYIGYAPANSTLSDPYWLIRKLVYDANGVLTDILFANGESKFNKVMSSYSGYTYSAS